MMQRLQDTINSKVRPILQAHDGDLSIVEITADGYVKVQFTGACSTCPGARQTLNEVVEAAFMESCPEIKGVILVSPVSDELIETALRMIRRKNLQSEA